MLNYLLKWIFITISENDPTEGKKKKVSFNTSLQIKFEYFFQYAG